MANSKKTGACDVCGRKHDSKALQPGGIIREGILLQIQEDNPRFSDKSHICTKCLNNERSEYISKTLKADEADMGRIEGEVFKSLKRQTTISKNMYKQYEKQLTFADKVSDKLAEFGGSWKFILMFAFFLFAWMAVNVFLLATRPFDPYPFILLNLVLSTLAAIQAPLIMMSQNRQEERDRLRAKHDYQVNLKAELEIRYLHEKLDLLLKNHWKRLLHIQQMQVDVLEELKRKKR